MEDAAAIAAAKLEFGEVENGIASCGYSQACADPSPPSTVIDLLEIRKDQEPHALWFPGLDHDGLVRRCGGGKDDEGVARGPSLRILFLNIKPMRGGNRVVRIHPKSLKFLRAHFGVSLLFLDCLGPIQWGAKGGNAWNDRYDEAGNVVQTDALYHLPTDGGPSDISFSHHQATQKSTYIISSCSARAKVRLLLCADSSDCLSLLRPMTVDTFLADAVSEGLKTNLQDARGRLLSYERHGASQIPTEQIQDTFQNLHDLSQTWHILLENLTDHEETLSFILTAHDHILSHSPTSATPNAPAIRYLQNRTSTWKRWVGNYTARTQIRINLYFNLASQSDNKTNLSIAHTSKRIAEATLRDSSSMITIATMTMLFLPGTFVSAILSMSFFNNGTDASGNPTLEVLPQWWIFPATTIPLTLLVFVLWRVWQQRRLSGKVREDAGKRASFLNLKQHALRWKSLFASDAVSTGFSEKKEQDDKVEMRGGSGMMGVFRRKIGGNEKIEGVPEDAP